MVSLLFVSKEMNRHRQTHTESLIIKHINAHGRRPNEVHTQVYMKCFYIYSIYIPTNGVVVSVPPYACDGQRQFRIKWCHIPCGGRAGGHEAEKTRNVRPDYFELMHFKCCRRFCTAYTLANNILKCIGSKYSGAICACVCMPVRMRVCEYMYIYVEKTINIYYCLFIMKRNRNKT